MEMAKDCWTWAKVDYEGTSYLNLYGIFRTITNDEDALLFLDDILPEYPSKHHGPNKFCLIENTIQATPQPCDQSVDSNDEPKKISLTRLSEIARRWFIESLFPQFGNLLYRRKLRLIDLSGFFLLSSYEERSRFNFHASEYIIIKLTNNCKLNGVVAPIGLKVQVPRKHFVHDNVSSIFSHKFALWYETLTEHTGSVFYEEQQILNALNDFRIHYRVIEPTISVKDGRYSVAEQENTEASSSINASSKVGKHKKPEKASLKSDLLIIAALTELILDNEKAPLKNQSHLIRVLKNRYPGLTGVGKGTLDKKLALANPILKQEKGKLLEEAQRVASKASESAK